MTGAITAPPVPVPLERRRLQCYLALVLVDILAIIAGFMIPGWLYLDEAGTSHASRISDLILPLFLTVGLYNGSYSREALEQSRVGAMHAVTALAIAAALTVFIAFYTKSSAEFSRFLFGSGTIATAMILVGLRYQMQGFITWRCAGGVTSQLVILDGGPPIDLPGAQHADAVALGIVPALDDPVSLHRIGVLPLAEQDRSVQYNLLAREADTNRALYDGLLQRYKELNASAGISTSNITIIDRADSPTSPSSPNLIRNLAFALLGGLGLAAIATFLRSQFDDIVRIPEDIESKLDLPLLGVVPLARDATIGEELADPKSAASESYNSLRSALLYSTSQGLPRSLLVSSSQPSEGKTTTSCELARGFARMGRRVLLVDVDLRRPTLHRQFELENGTGLSSLLTQQVKLDQVIRNAGQENLDVVTSGPVPPNPTELIASEQMAELVDAMTTRYDVVIFDSPPILGLADAPLMSALVDGVVFIVESGRGRHGSLKASLRRLRTMRPLMLGAVLTMFDAAKAGHRYSEYSGYDYYRYGAGNKPK